MGWIWDVDRKVGHQFGNGISLWGNSMDETMDTLEELEQPWDSTTEQQIAQPPLCDERLLKGG